MRFIVDAQLPPALAQFFRESGHEAEHVYEIGLADASDEKIWQAAVSVFWIRIGNCSNRVLVEKLRPLLKGIVERLQQGERLVEVI